MSSPIRVTEFIHHWLNQIQQPPEKQFLSELETTLSASEYVLNAIESDADLLNRFYQQRLDRSTPNATALQISLQHNLTQVVSEEEFSSRLRRFRKQQMVRIIWRDLNRTASLDETLESLSALADASIQAALDFHHALLVNKLGVPQDANGKPQQLVVIAMGKLGARELNLSSDIDLIYCFESVGNTDSRRRMSNEEFFTRLAQKLTKALSGITADGFVFRVDTRLRPFGESGPLVPSFDFLENYYQSQAREWERYAMIKARIVAGDFEAGARLMELLKPFVYRRYLDFEAIENLRHMKKMIATNLKQKGLSKNIKLGPGGIREIEFLGQVFQLIRAGQDSELQMRPIQPVLRLLAEKEYIEQQTANELIAAYRFLRLVENRIQAWRDEQTHLLPEDDEGLQRIARTMGFEKTDNFTQQLHLHRTDVSEHFKALFRDPEAEEGAMPGFSELWHGQHENPEDFLKEQGFPDGEQALKQIYDLRDSHSLQAAGERGKLFLDTLMPKLLELITQTANTMETLTRAAVIIQTIAKRTTYLALLNEHPQALEQLVTLLSSSPWFEQWIRRMPILLDTLIDKRQLYQPLDSDTLKQQLAEQLKGNEGDQEREMEVLRHFVAANRLAVAAADVEGAIPLMAVSNYLTWIAEVALEAATRIAWRDVSDKYGEPQNLQSDETGFAIVAYGKMGGLELGYSSDLDIVFLHNQPSTAVTNGKREIAVDTFYARLVQRLIHIVTTRTSSGRLYEIDMRLRPNGKSGLLVTPLVAFEAYQHKDAWIWEHQALARARVIYGDQKLTAEFKRIRHEVLTKKRQEFELNKAVKEMREKMRTSLDKSNDQQFDLKQGYGGIADIEFIVQYHLLLLAHQKNQLIEFSDNIRQLEALEDSGLFDRELAQQLSKIYRVLRGRQHRLALQEAPALITSDEFKEERHIVRKAWNHIFNSNGD